MILGKSIDYVVKLGAIAAGLLLVFIALSIGYTIFARAVGLASPLWTVQFNEYALLWMTFLGTAWVLGKNRHVAIDLLTRSLKPRTKAIFGVVHSTVGFGLCAVIFWFGLLTVWSMFQRGVTDVGTVDVPKYLVLIAIPFGFLLLALQFVRRAVTSLLSMRASGSTQGDAGSGGCGTPE